MKKIVKKEKTKGRSEEGRGSKDKIRKNAKREIVKDIKNVGKGMALAASLVPAGRAVKAVKAAKAAKAAKNAPKTKVNLPPPPPGSKPTYGPKKSPYKSQDEINRAAAAERKAAQDRKSYLAREAKKTPSPPKPSKPGLRRNYGGWMS